MMGLAAYAARKLGAGRVDIWVNNAGATQTFKALVDEADPRVLMRVVDTNLTGAMFGAGVALRAMRIQATGGKVFFLDGAGGDGDATPRSAAYGASKRGLSQLVVPNPNPTPEPLAAHGAAP
jgi:chlorophyll(ide) b reductase